MSDQVKKEISLDIAGNCELQSYKDGELIYDLMMETLIEDYVNSLEDNIGKIVKSEFTEGTVCEELFKNIYRIQEAVQKWMGLDVEEGEIYFLVDSFYRLLNVTTVYSYNVALKNLELDNWEGFDNQVIKMQGLHYQMIEAGINITNSLDANKAEEIEKLLNTCTKVILIFAQRARDYGAFFRQYETLK